MWTNNRHFRAAQDDGLQEDMRRTQMYDTRSELEDQDSKSPHSSVARHRWD